MTLNPAKRYYTDISTLNDFQFIFYCECCGKGVKSEKYAFSTDGVKQPIAENVRALLWTRQHQEAYQRAMNEEKFDFNICLNCGHKVCGKCFHLDTELISGLCTDCKIRFKKR